MTALDGLLKGHEFSKRNYTIYSIRSTFIENRLSNKMDILLLSRVCGYSVDILERHYERIQGKSIPKEINNINYGEKKKQINKIDLFG
tara:strand:- start:1022 stop:1285 length:264 start_codon:yes stop_codon:yes gene_type:complete